MKSSIIANLIGALIVGLLYRFGFHATALGILPYVICNCCDIVILEIKLESGTTK